MKKLLLGTSAFVAAGLFSSGAFAQTATTDQPIQMKFGGQYYTGFAANIQTDDNPGEAGYKRQPTALQDYFLIRFLGSTTFSNGITAGVFTRLNAFSAPNATVTTTTGFQSSNNTTIKDSYVYLKNTANWGEFRIGDDSDVRRNDAVGVNAGVTGDQNIGANSSDIYFSGSPVFNETTLNLDGRGTKLVYYSPTVMGFHLGLSYTPDKAGGHTNGPGNIGDNNGPTDNQTNGLFPSYLNNATAYNYWSVAGGWAGTVGPVKIAYTLGYSTASRKGSITPKTALGADTLDTSLTSTNNANPQVYNTGVQFNYGPWELGADYEQSMAIPGSLEGGLGAATAFNAAGLPTAFTVKSNEMINKQSDVNISYTIGAIRMGAEWSRGSFEGITGDANIKRAADNDVIQVGATYTVGPGVNIAGLIQETLYNPNGAYVPAGPSFVAAAGGVATNNNVFAKSFNATALIMETSFRF